MAQHWLFQLANVFLLLSYLVPDILFLRVSLACAGVCFVLWGALVLGVSVDTITWNTIFAVVNTVQAIRIIYSRRPIKFSSPEHEAIYETLFAPVGVSRLNFRKLADASLSRALKAESVFIERGNEASNLTLIQSGYMSVSTVSDGEEIVVNDCRPFEFVESPEWSARIREQSKKIRLQRKNSMKKLNFLHPSKLKNVTIENPTMSSFNQQEITLNNQVDLPEKDTIMNVTIRTTTDCTFIMWPVETLLGILRATPELAAPISSIVAADVANKLFRQTGRKSQALRKIGTEMNSPKRELTEEDLKIIEGIKSIFGIEGSHIDMKVLFDLGRKREYTRKGTILCREGEKSYYLFLLIEGNVEILKKDATEIAYRVGALQLIGSPEFTDVKNDHVMRITATIAGPSKLIVWDCEDLRKLTHERPSLQIFVSTWIAADISRKFIQIDDESTSSSKMEVSSEKQS